MAKILIIMWFILLASISTWLGAVGDAANRYTTQPGDTLWDIARRFVADDTMTTQQMVWELFDANPDAFINHNINQLKIGYTLRIPVPEARLMTRSSPETGAQRSEVASTESLDAQIDAPPEPPGQATAIMKNDMAPAIAPQEISKLQHELARTQEQAIRQRDENQTLRTRIADLEAKMMTMTQIASEPNATGSDDMAAPPPQPPSRRAVWWTIPNIMMLMGVLLLLALAVIWVWRQRTAMHTAAPMSEQSHAAPPTTDATEPCALGSSDLNTEAEAATDARRPDLMIDLDDLELGSAQEGSTASISPKGVPSPPSNAC